MHSTANYRGPALTGDITIQTAEVVDKMVNQRGVTMCTGKAEIKLQKKD